MTTVAIDIQPQFRFTCMAANATHFLLRPENMVNELNRQAALADKRVLIENVSIDPESICATVVNRNGVMFGRPSGFFSQCAGGCRGTHLLQGLPSPADYDHALELSGKHVHGACFHEANEANSTGLLEWLHEQKADTVIIGGLAIEETVANTAKQLSWYSDNLHIIVNLGPCHGYAPESTIETIYQMRKMGITVASNAEAIPELMRRFSGINQVKVS